VNQAKLGETVAELMETIDNASLPESAEIHEVMVIAVVAWPLEDDNRLGQNGYYRCSSALLHVQTGLLHTAQRAIDASTEPFEEDDE
jgi:hypothetical protein